MRTTLIGAWLVLIVSATAGAQAPQPPPIPALITNGLNAIEEGRCRDAFDSWTADWTYGQYAVRRQTLISGCDGLHELGATVHGHQIVQVVYVTPFLCRVYVVLRFDRHPVYLMVVGYAPVDNEWRVTAINWSRDPDEVFPVTMLDPEKPAR